MKDMVANISSTLHAEKAIAVHHYHQHFLLASLRCQASFITTFTAAVIYVMQTEVVYFEVVDL